MKGKTRRSFLRRTLLPLTAAAATALGVTAAAPGEARADFTPAGVAYDVAINLVFMVAGDGLSNVWGSSSSLSAYDLTTIEDDIQTIMSDLTTTQYSTAMSSLTTALTTRQSYSTKYGSGTSCTALQTAYTDIVQGASYEPAALTAMNDFYGLIGVSGENYSMTAIAGYTVSASIYLSWLKEQYQLEMAMNNNCPSGDGYSWGGGLDTALGNVKSQAATTVSNLRTWAGYFEGQFPASTWVHTQIIGGSWCNTASCDDCLARKRYANNCFTYSPYGGSSTTLCPNSSLSETSDPTQQDDFLEYQCSDFDDWKNLSSNSVVTGSQVNGSIFLQQMKMYYRDNQLGAGFYETLAGFQQIANGSFDYCGNGTCGITEVGWCTQDCGSTSSDAGTGIVYASWPSSSSATTLTTSEAQTLVTYGGYNLDWQADGNLVLYNASKVAVWETNTSGSATTLVFDTTSTDTAYGNLMLKNSSGTVVWASETDGSSPATNLVLLDGDVYLTDAFGGVQWSSASDFHIYTALSTAPNGGQTGTERFCRTMSPTGFTEYLLLNPYTGYALIDYGGDLRVGPWTLNGVSYTWHSNTAGATYMCVQEDGNMAIYGTSSTTALWSTNNGNVTGTPSTYGNNSLNTAGLTANAILPNQGLATTTNAWGGELVLVGDQLRLLSASGEPMWSSTTCTSAWQCGYDNQVAMLAVNSSSDQCWTTGSSATTLLSTEYAELDWGTDGNLVLYDKTAEIFNPTQSYAGNTGDYSPPSIDTGSKRVLWESNTSGTGHQVCLKSDGALGVKNSSGTTVFGSSAGGYGVVDLVLAGCNLSLANSSGTVVASTNTNCTYADSAETYFSTTAL